jgi:hypothetical protein
VTYTISNARIGYQNLLESGTVVASTADANYPVANAYDWRTSDFYKPTGTGTTTITLTLSSSASADYFAFYNQDIWSFGGTIKLQYFNGSIYVDCFTALSPADNTPVMKTFTTQSSTQWRVTITSSSIFSLACVSFGTHLALEYGMYLNWSPPILARDTTLVTSKADGGAFLGRSVVAKGIKSEIQLQYASDAWLRDNWVAFVKRAEQKPFFFVPDIVNHPSEAVFAWVEDAIPPIQQTQFGYGGATLPIRGLIE